MGIEQISKPKLPWSARITLGLGFGFTLAANSLQGENPLSGLAVIVILPALFVLGLAAGIVIAGFARRPAWLSPARSLLTAALLSISMAAGAYAR
jgi:hypothetical protein